VESLLKVGRRRAQQILLGCPHHRLGRNLLVSQAAFREFLLQSAASTLAQSETIRLQRLARQIDSWHQQFLTRPPLLVEAPASVAHTRLDSLPPGINLSAHSLHIQHQNRQDLLEKLLALVCALAQDDFLNTPY